MTVYVIQARGTDLVKIGFTKRATPIARLLSLKTGCPLPLIVLAYVPGAPRSLERELHLQFRFQRSTLAGREWFRLNADERSALVHQLGSPTVPKVDPDFATKACTPESEYGPVIFGPHTELAGYLGVYDDDEDLYCPKHESEFFEDDDLRVHLHRRECLRRHRVCHDNRTLHRHTTKEATTRVQVSGPADVEARVASVLHLERGGAPVRVSVAETLDAASERDVV